MTQQSLHNWEAAELAGSVWLRGSFHHTFLPFFSAHLPMVQRRKSCQKYAHIQLLAFGELSGELGSFPNSTHPFSGPQVSHL